MKKEWFVYIIQCSDNTLYTGVTINIDRRINEHNNSVKGAVYTKSRRPVKLKYLEGPMTKSVAFKREKEIKKMKRIDKIKLMEAIMDKDISKYIYDQIINKIKNLTDKDEKIDYAGFFKNISSGFEQALNDFGIKCSVLIGDGGSFNLGDRFKFFVKFEDGYQLTLFYFIINNNILTIEIDGINYTCSSLDGLEIFVNNKCFTPNVLEILVKANDAGLKYICE